MLPRRPQDTHRRPQEAPKLLQAGPRWLQDCHICLKDFQFLSKGERPKADVQTRADNERLTIANALGKPFGLLLAWNWLAFGLRLACL